MKKDKYDYVIYHKGCTDGFSGFVVLTMTDMISNNALIYPDFPSTNRYPPNIKNKNVIIIDVAYKKDILKHILNKAKKVTFIDHHITVKDDVQQLKSLMSNKNHEIIYDNDKSGASLTWQYFFNTKPIPLAIQYIESNDIGNWTDKNTMIFIIALRVNYDMSTTSDNLDKWRKLFNSNNIDATTLLKKGEQYNEYHNHLLQDNIKKNSIKRFPSEKLYSKHKSVFTKPGQYKVVVYNGSGCPTSSSLGAIIVNSIDCDFAILWVLNLDKNEYILQFRSKHVDVGTIAKEFGGGGHKLASACSFSAKNFNIRDLFM